MEGLEKTIEVRSPALWGGRRICQKKQKKETFRRGRVLKVRQRETPSATEGKEDKS